MNRSTFFARLGQAALAVPGMAFLARSVAPSAVPAVVADEAWIDEAGSVTAAETFQTTALIHGAIDGPGARSLEAAGFTHFQTFVEGAEPSLPRALAEIR